MRTADQPTRKRPPRQVGLPPGPIVIIQVRDRLGHWISTRNKLEIAVPVVRSLAEIPVAPIQRIAIADFQRKEDSLLRFGDPPLRTVNVARPSFPTTLLVAGGWQAIVRRTCQAHNDEGNAREGCPPYPAVARRNAFERGSAVERKK